MGFREKFQGAKMSANKDIQKNAEENNKSFYKNDGRAGFLNIDEGRNVIRILPPHPDSKIAAAYLASRSSMLKCELEVYEDGEPSGKTEVKNKKIFIATQHGGLAKDPIEVYIDYVRKYAEDAIDDKKERQKFLYPITGWSDKSGWHWGINPKTTFVAYAIKDGKFGRIELYEGWIKEMNKLAIAEEVDEVMAVDPFSDPNEGFPLIIDKNKNDRGKWEYSIMKDEPSRAKRESWTEFFNRTMVSDAHLEELVKQQPLTDFYGTDVYTMRDFELAVDGLRRFDEENKYFIFENEDFLAEMEEIEKVVKPAKEKNTDADLKNSFEKEKEKEAVSEEVSIPEMKMELKRFITKTYGASFVDQIPFSKVQVQKWYALMEEGSDLPIEMNDKKDPEPEPEQKKTVADEAVTKVASKVQSDGEVTEDQLSDQIAKLRARRNAGK